MKFGKGVVFSLVFAVSVSFVFSQAVLGPVAEWKRPGIIVSPGGVIIAGNTIEVSATIKILKNVKGLKYKGGVDTGVIKDQTFPGLLAAGTTIPVKFNWVAARGRHNLFFRLILPGKPRRPVVKKLNKSINVLPKRQHPGDNTNVINPAGGAQDLCAANQTAQAKVKIKGISVQYNPANKNIIYTCKIYNDSPRCIKKLVLDVKFVKSKMYTHSVEKITIDPVSPTGKWALRSFEERSIMGHFILSDRFLPGGNLYDWSSLCSFNREHKCLRIRFYIVPTVPSGTGNTKEEFIDIGPVE